MGVAVQSVSGVSVPALTGLGVHAEVSRRSASYVKHWVSACREVGASVTEVKRWEDTAQTPPER